jgi:serine/threonine-protein kinase
MTAKPSRAAPRRRAKRKLLPKTVAGRRRLTAVVVLLVAGLSGYLITCIAYPSPLFNRGNVVERVIGLPQAEAEKRLTTQGFRVKIDGEEADPMIPAGSVLWQDPPPETILSRGSPVHLLRSTGPSSIAVPDLAQFDVDQATKVLIAAGLKVGSIDTVPSRIDAGSIVATRPGSGTGLPAGSPVGLVVSRGPATIRVPSLLGLSQNDARARVEAAGLKVGRILHRSVRRTPAGTVVDQRPNAGTLSPKDARVDIIIAEN